MHYSMSFPEWNLSERLKALKLLCLVINFDESNHTVDIKSSGGVDALGSVHREAVKFICDPVYSPIMYNMDVGIGRIVTRLHSEFWHWKFNMPYIDIEAEIAHGIRNYVEDLDCKEQDKWLFFTASDLKEHVVTSSKEFLNQNLWMTSTVGEHTLRHLSSVIMDNRISWSRIRNLTL